MQGLREQSRDYEILQILGVILHHLDVSPCHAVIICHMSPVTLEWAHVICMVQSNIYSAQYYSHQYLPALSGSINTYTERKQ